MVKKAKLLTEITFDREENGFDCRNICIELPFPAENGQKACGGASSGYAMGNKG